MRDCLRWDANERLTAAASLQMPYFRCHLGDLTIYKEAEKNPPPETQARLTTENFKPSSTPTQPYLPSVKPVTHPYVQSVPRPTSRKDNVHPSGPSSGRTSRADDAPFSATQRNNFNPAAGDLPKLAALRKNSGARSGSGGNRSGGHRYLKMARYQPGMQQTPITTQMKPIIPPQSHNPAVYPTKPSYGHHSGGSGIPGIPSALSGISGLPVLNNAALLGLTPHAPSASGQSHGSGRPNLFGAAARNMF